MSTERVPHAAMDRRLSGGCLDDPDDAAAGRTRCVSMGIAWGYSGALDKVHSRVRKGLSGVRKEARTRRRNGRHEGGGRECRRGRTCADARAAMDCMTKGRRENSSRTPPVEPVRRGQCVASPL